MNFECYCRGMRNLHIGVIALADDVCCFYVFFSRHNLLRQKMSSRNILRAFTRKFSAPAGTKGPRDPVEFFRHGTVEDAGKNNQNSLSQQQMLILILCTWPFNQFWVDQKLVHLGPTFILLIKKLKIVIILQIWSH